MEKTRFYVICNTVYIIGSLDDLGVAESAVDMLLTGSEHAAVYRFLENKQRELRMSRLDSIDTR